MAETLTALMGGDGALDPVPPGDVLLPTERRELVPLTGKAMDGEKARALHRKLLTWFNDERDRQAANRLEMAIDADFYDNMQWRDEDAQVLRERGQSPLVYNEIAPMIDWVIGTERRTRVDWKVLPRTEEDVQLADIKTQVLKYVSDVNRAQFARSAAFDDAVKVGVGWIDDGVRDDPTKDAVYTKHEDWRRVLWDSRGSSEPDLEDARYVFRWRWVDEDVARLMFPERVEAIAAAADSSTRLEDFAEDEELSTGFGGPNEAYNGRAHGRSSIVSERPESGGIGRLQVKIIECQYREPVPVKVVAGGPFAGSFLTALDQPMVDALARQPSARIVDRVMMRVHVAVFTESAMLSYGPSIYRHNRFSLTPVWCYRRMRDRLPYGIARRVRDVQEDVNKRASKAQFLLNTNQIIADKDAVDDWDIARDEASRPDGVVVKNPGREFRIERHLADVTGQVNLMALGAQSIQKSAGVSQENLGRQTNAVSGEAIKARQLQGSVVTTQIFDNLRYATQISGEKQLSHVEQFYTEEKVMRVTGSRGAVEWVKVNEYSRGEDGHDRILNDISASQADFIVAEQDYAGTMRQVMFEALNALAQRLPPEVALKLLTVAMEFSDLPNKEEVAEQFRKITGEPNPNKEPTPEEMQAQQQAQQQQQEALDLQRADAQLALQERQAKVRETNARAAQLEYEVQAGAMDPAKRADIEDQIQAVRTAAQDEIERLSQDLAQATAENQRLLSRIDDKAEAERVRAASQERVAEIAAGGDRALNKINERLAELEQAVQAPTTSPAPAAPAADATPPTPPGPPMPPPPGPAEPMDSMPNPPPACTVPAPAAMNLEAMPGDAGVAPTDFPTPPDEEPSA